jgi:hypothetical protein
MPIAEIPASTDPVRVMKYYRALWLAYHVSSDEAAGNATNKAADAASACNLFCELERGETGGVGTGLSAGFTQQAGVAQCLESQPVQQHVDFALPPLVSALAEVVKTPCQARRNPSQRIIAVFMYRSFMFRGWSECPPNLLRKLSHYPRCGNTCSTVSRGRTTIFRLKLMSVRRTSGQGQFFSVPQSSMDLP